MNKTKFNELVLQLKEHIDDRANHTYSICHILYAIRHSKLYELTGYESFREFCELSDIGISHSNASKHASCYSQLERLRYKKDESIAIVREFGVGHVIRLLKDLHTKVKISTLRRHSQEYYREHSQINFTMDASQLEFVENILMQHGMDFHDSGIRVNASDALIAALEKLVGRKAA